MSHEWYPWYPALYKADTMHLTAEQDGIYRRLIDHYMETRQPLPANDAALARIAGVDMQTWTNALAIVEPFFNQGSDGLLHHKRCDLELDRQDKLSKNHSERGKKGAEKRWKNQQPDSSSHALAIAESMLVDSTRQDKTRQKEANASSAETKKIDFDFAVGKFTGITKRQYETWCEAFPAINVDAEIRKAAVWLTANPKNRKSNYSRFLANWLTKTQDKAARVGASSGVTPLGVGG